MPRQTCTVCAHKDRESIDQALREGRPSIREIAKQSRLTSAAVFRHKQHTFPDKLPSNEEIPKEITKLRHAQAAAKRRRDTDAVLAISREIRAWMLLKAKTKSVLPRDRDKPEELSRSEALTLAKQIIEGQLDDPSVVSWLEESLSRAGQTQREPVNATKAQE